jgi:uncharacterized protein YPO0396
LSFAQNVKVYSDEEYKKLKKEEVEKYWADLENAIKSYEEKRSEIQAKIDAKEESIKNLENEIASVDQEINNYSAKKSDLEATIEKSTGIPYNVFITLPSKSLSFASPTFGISRVISSCPNFVSRTSTE